MFKSNVDSIKYKRAWYNYIHNIQLSPVPPSMPADPLLMSLFVIHSTSNGVDNAHGIINCFPRQNRNSALVLNFTLVIIYWILAFIFKEMMSELRSIQTNSNPNQAIYTFHLRWVGGEFILDRPTSA